MNQHIDPSQFGGIYSSGSNMVQDTSQSPIPYSKLTNKIWIKKWQGEWYWRQYWFIPAPAIEWYTDIRCTNLKIANTHTILKYAIPEEEFFKRVMKGEAIEM